MSVLKEIGSRVKNYDFNNEKIQSGRSEVSNFITKFPFRNKPELIDNLTAEQIYQKGSNETFFYWAEFGTKNSGALRVGQDEVYKNAIKNIAQFKRLLKIAVDDSKSVSEKIDAPWEDITGFGSDKHVAKKIITLYYPEKLLHIFSTKHLERFVAQLRINMNVAAAKKFNKTYYDLTIGQKFQLLNEVLMDWREKNLPEIDNHQFAYFLYDIVRDSSIGLNEKFKLSLDQAKALKTWYINLDKEELENWYRKQIECHNRYQKILKDEKFKEGKDLSIEDWHKIFSLLESQLGNIQLKIISGPTSIFKNNSLKELNQGLRDLLFGEGTLIQRFTNFIKLKRIKEVTASQFLSVFDHQNFAFYNDFMNSVFSNNLKITDLQLLEAEKDAEKEFQFKAGQTGSRTRKYFTLFMILKSIKELLKLESYFEVQNVLWMIKEKDFQLEIENPGFLKQVSYFILRTGGGEYNDIPAKSYHFRAGIPGSNQLKNSAENAEFAYYELNRGGFWAKGKIGKIKGLQKEDDTELFAEVVEYKELDPIDFESIRTKVSFDSIGQAGIRKISEEDFSIIIKGTKNNIYSVLNSPLNLKLQDISFDKLIFEERDALISQIFAALKSGKNLMLLGPPGTGKTEIALALCKMAKEKFYINDFVLTTATSDWTTFDTIGGYVPEKDGKGLVFIPGQFLRCFKSGNTPVNKWLIIDEINRSDIDKAFGQLFTILSGQTVELPYQTSEGSITITPSESWDNEPVKLNEYIVPKSWRLLASLNTFDKASLYQMSYAFMRRFAFIYVNVPSSQFIEENWDKYVKSWKIDVPENMVSIVKNIKDIWKEMNQDHSKRPIGPAVIKDMLELIMIQGNNIDQLDDAQRKNLITFAVCAYILPQFEGLEEDDLKPLAQKLCQYCSNNKIEAQVKELYDLKSDLK